MRYNAKDISVLVCVHSTELWNDKALGYAIDSLMRQELDGFKILVVLDNCWANTYFAIQGYISKDFRILEKYNLNGKSGLADAKNYGLQRIKTKLVAFLDADDEYMPSKLEAQLEYFNSHPEVDFLGTHSLYRDISDLTFTKPSFFDENTYNTHEDIKNRIFEENVLTHGSMMIKTTALKTLGGYRNIKGMEDWDLWKRAFKTGFCFYQMPLRLYIYTLNTSVAR